MCSSTASMTSGVDAAGEIKRPTLTPSLSRAMLPHLRQIPRTRLPRRPVLVSYPRPAAFATSLTRPSSEAVELPYSATPQPKPEEKATELPSSSAVDQTEHSGEDGSVADAIHVEREIVKGQVYVSNVFPVQLGKVECVPPQCFSFAIPFLQLQID